MALFVCCYLHGRGVFEEVVHVTDTEAQIAQLALMSILWTSGTDPASNQTAPNAGPVVLPSDGRPQAREYRPCPGAGVR